VKHHMTKLKYDWSITQSNKFALILFQVYKATSVQMRVVLWVVTSCHIPCLCHHFRERYCLHLQLTEFIQDDSVVTETMSVMYEGSKALGQSQLQKYEGMWDLFLNDGSSEIQNSSLLSTMTMAKI
jgi:hypothetical protein